MGFVHHSLSIGCSVEVMKIVERESSENHSSVMSFVHHCASVADFVQVIRILEEKSIGNHSFLMRASGCLQFDVTSSKSSTW